MGFLNVERAFGGYPDPSIPISNMIFDLRLEPLIGRERGRNN